jgi:hypothetical protein
METINFKVPPVIKTIRYTGTTEEAFDRFTRDIGTWWPLATHSLGKSDNALSVGFERLEAGGALVELCRSGDRHVWGFITDIRRPRLVSFTWHVGRLPDTAQLIEVTFDPNEDRTTKVTLTHSGWERLGDRALEAQQSYSTGWDPVLARYVNSGQDQL